MSDQVVIIGGGLAGITAALRLADSGVDVVLLERRPRLGGAASSFRRGDLTIDNGQHVFLRCCTAYRGLLDRIGATGDTTVQARLEIPVIAGPGWTAAAPGTVGMLKRTPGLPAPAHLLAALARYRLLRPRDRLRVLRGALGLRGLDLTDHSLDVETFGCFLRRHGQNDATVAGLFDVVGTATLNLPADRASLALAAMVLRTGLLDHASAADVGRAVVPLARLHDDAAAAALAAGGVAVRRRHRATALTAEGLLTVVTASGERYQLSGRRVILAVPSAIALQIAPFLAAVKGIDRLGHAPIVNVHVVYDRPVTDRQFAAAVGSPVQWVFDRTRASGLAERNHHAQYLAVTISAAFTQVDQPTEVLREQFLPALADLFPAARSARVLDVFVTRERQATFCQAPGSGSARPGPCVSASTAVRLAGAWTDTGWPDTMESAVRSGRAAADAVLGTEQEKGGDSEPDVDC